MAPSLGDVEQKTYIGKRMNIGEVLSKELSDSVTTVVVLVSGPSEMVLEFGIYSPIMLGVYYK